MYFLKRILSTIPLLLVISFAAFLLVRAAPGGPFDSERRPAAPEIERNLRAKYHLDEPLWKQYARYVGGLVQGDFGPSLKYRNHTVTDVIAQALPVSLTLGLLAFCFAQGVGIPLGVFAATRRGRWPDHLLSVGVLLGVCVPGLLIAPLLIMGFALHWRWFPVGQWETPGHAVLPTLALGLYFAARISRLMREGMAGVLQAEFITTARAKGLSETAVVFTHAFRLAVLPVVSYSGPLLADLLTGSFVVETAFKIPGLGVFFVNSMLNRDHTMTVGLVLVYAVLLLGLNLLADLTYRLLDPRVKYE